MRDDFPEQVKRVIANRANLVCSNPDCQASTCGPQENPTKALNIGVAAHITAASPAGPRYNPSLTPEERSSATNGIWLCQNCAKKVDNDPLQYDSELLQAWRKIREHSALHSIGQTQSRAAETESEKKYRQISKWKGQRILLVKMATPQQAPMLGPRPWNPISAVILDCTDFFVTVKGEGWDKSRTITLGNIEIGHDYERNLPELLEYNR